MTAASISIEPFRRRADPVPALKRGSSSRRATAVSTASSAEPPDRRDRNPSLQANSGPSLQAEGEPAPPCVTMQAFGVTGEPLAQLSKGRGAEKKIAIGFTPLIPRRRESKHSIDFYSWLPSLDPRPWRLTSPQRTHQLGAFTMSVLNPPRGQNGLSGFLPSILRYSLCKGEALLRNSRSRAWRLAHPG